MSCWLAHPGQRFAAARRGQQGGNIREAAGDIPVVDTAAAGIAAAVAAYIPEVVVVVAVAVVADTVAEAVDTAAVAVAVAVDTAAGAGIAAAQGRRQASARRSGRIERRPVLVFHILYKVPWFVLLSLLTTYGRELNLNILSGKNPLCRHSSS